MTTGRRSPTTTDEAAFSPRIPGYLRRCFQPHHALKVNLGTAFDGSPVVYNGMVIVANQSFITALSAATGQTIWSHFVGNTLATPTIDPADGLVFIGEHNSIISTQPPYYSGPSTFYALRLSDRIGSLARLA